MNEQIKTKKKLSKFGKVWILVCVIAATLGVLVATFAVVLPEMEYYNDHEHSFICIDNNGNLTSNCPLSYYDSALSDAIKSILSYVAIALLLANVVMLDIWLVHRSVKNPVAPVDIPLNEGEQTVLSRCYPTLFPIVLLVLGELNVLSFFFSIIRFLQFLRFGVPLYYLLDTLLYFGLPLIVGIVFIVVGVLLYKVMKIHLVVTTKRVYLKAPFASRVNLPLNRIAAVSTGLFHYLQITSAAGMFGQIRLFFVPKYLEVYDTINALLNEVE